MILPICVISLYCNIKDLFETYLYKSESSDDKCIDSQHFGTCDSHTDFKIKSQSNGAGTFCGGHLAAQLVIIIFQSCIFGAPVFFICFQIDFFSVWYCDYEMTEFNAEDINYQTCCTW